MLIGTSRGGKSYQKSLHFSRASPATIVAGGDIVLPLSGYWNLQLGGAFHTDHEHFNSGGSESLIQFQGGVVGFWRDSATGVFGIEGGVFSPSSNNDRRFNFNSAKIGGVAEFFFSDMITIGGFGGVLLPFNPHSGKGGKEVETGFYAGSHLTYYASDNLAIAGFARFAELNSDLGEQTESDRSLNVGGKVRYLTSMPGVEIYASGSYRECEHEFTRSGRTSGFSLNGGQFMGGVQIRLGGYTDNLVAIDRSNAIDTRAWACDGFEARSDRRLKTDIASLGEAADGIRLYSWKYLDDPVNTWVGVMAQDLETSHPEALVTGTDGLFRVNYSSLGVQMMTLEQWNARRL